MAATRVGVSAKQVQRDTGVTYKTAWRMMKQIRILMADSGKLLSPVEMDEAQFGGSDENKHSHLRGKSKTRTLLPDRVRLPPPYSLEGPPATREIGSVEGKTNEAWTFDCPRLQMAMMGSATTEEKVTVSV
jgi:hypothetical protein